MILSNPHTHSIYCDGKSTLEESIIRAVDLGFESIGFTGHAYTPFDTDYCMSKFKTNEYFKELSYLKRKYKDKIDVAIGIEYDKYSEVDLKNLDFLIYSVHYIKKGQNYLPVDFSEENMLYNVEKYYKGDFSEYFSDYYKEYLNFKKPIENTIVGHFDLITRFNFNNKYFDTTSEKYKKCSSDALNIVLKENPVFEVNTSSILKNLRSTPYPDIFLLNYLCLRKVNIILSSDCHDAKNLNYAFYDTSKLLYKCGFRKCMIITSSGFKERILAKL